MNVPPRPHLEGPVYIAGPMTGLPDFNVPAFKAAEKWLLENYPGIEVKSPHHNSFTDGAPGSKPYGAYFRKGLADLVTCETIILLEGFMASEGAKAEFGCAELMNIARFIIADSQRVGKYLVDVTSVNFWKTSA